MKPKEEQSKLGPRNLVPLLLTCKLPVTVNLKLLAAKTHRRLSLTDSLAELLVLTDLEIEMVEREKKRKRKRKPWWCSHPCWRRAPVVESSRGQGSVFLDSPSFWWLA